MALSRSRSRIFEAGVGASKLVWTLLSASGSGGLCGQSRRDQSQMDAASLGVPSPQCRLTQVGWPVTSVRSCVRRSSRYRGVSVVLGRFSRHAARSGRPSAARSLVCLSGQHRPGTGGASHERCARRRAQCEWSRVVPFGLVPSHNSHFIPHPSHFTAPLHLSALLASSYPQFTLFSPYISPHASHLIP